MSTETNRETIRRTFVAWRDEGAPVADVSAPGITWRIEGRSVVAGDYADRQEFIDGHGVANDGIAYDNSYAWFVTLRDALVVDGTAYFDSIAFDELWQRVEPALARDRSS